MTKPSLGTKRTCPSCAAHFYDLNHSPAVCPKCSHSFDPSVTVRVRRKPAKSAASVENTLVIQESILASKKKNAPRKKGKGVDEEGVGDSIGELMEMDDADDMESIHELSELEEMEEETVNEDDADEEALIEDLDTGDNVIIEDVEEEEAMTFQEGDEEQGSKKKRKKKAEEQSAKEEQRSRK